MAHILALDAHCGLASPTGFVGIDLKANGVAPSVLAHYIKRGKGQAETGVPAGGRRERGKSSRQGTAEDWLEELAPRPPAAKKPSGMPIVEKGLCEDCGQPFISRRTQASKNPKRRFCDACRSRRSVEASRAGMAKIRAEKADGEKKH
jgi:hypothetical protein